MALRETDPPVSLLRWDVATPPTKRRVHFSISFTLCWLVGHFDQWNMVEELLGEFVDPGP